MDSIETGSSNSSAEADKPLTKSPLVRQPKPILCQVKGCGFDVTHQTKLYCLRKRICPSHLAALSVNLDRLGGILLPYRFCHQCGKFELLSCFDGTQRSCRARLLWRRSFEKIRRFSKRVACAAAAVAATNVAIISNLQPLGPHADPAAATAINISTQCSDTSSVLNKTEQQVQNSAVSEQQQSNDMAVSRLADQVSRPAREQIVQAPNPSGEVETSKPILSTHLSTTQQTAHTLPAASPKQQAPGFTSNMAVPAPAATSFVNGQQQQQQAKGSASVAAPAPAATTAVNGNLLVLINQAPASTRTEAECASSSEGSGENTDSHQQALAAAGALQCIAGTAESAPAAATTGVQECWDFMDAFDDALGPDDFTVDVELDALLQQLQDEMMSDKKQQHQQHQQGKKEEAYGVAPLPGIDSMGSSSNFQATATALTQQGFLQSSHIVCVAATSCSMVQTPSQQQQQRPLPQQHSLAGQQGVPGGTEPAPHEQQQQQGTPAVAPCLGRQPSQHMLLPKITQQPSTAYAQTVQAGAGWQTLAIPCLSTNTVIHPPETAPVSHLAAADAKSITGLLPLPVTLGAAAPAAAAAAAMQAISARKEELLDQLITLLCNDEGGIAPDKAPLQQDGSLFAACAALAPATAAAAGGMPGMVASSQQQQQQHPAAPLLWGPPTVVGMQAAMVTAEVPISNSHQLMLAAAPAGNAMVAASAHPSLRFAVEDRVAALQNSLDQVSTQLTHLQEVLAATTRDSQQHAGPLQPMMASVQHFPRAYMPWQQAPATTMSSYSTATVMPMLH